MVQHTYEVDGIKLDQTNQEFFDYARSGKHATTSGISDRKGRNWQNDFSKIYYQQAQVSEQ